MRLSATWPSKFMTWASFPVAIGVWDQVLKNYAPNIGFDYGGRLMAAWLDR
jgi:hypothetical protein